MNREPFDLEFFFKESPSIIYQYLTIPECLRRWYCDEVEIVNNQYYYTFDSFEEVAEIIEDIEDEYVKLKWDDGEFLEFKLSRSPYTGQTSLLIKDGADEDEVGIQIDFWTTAIEELKRILSDK